jgi:hypothetical protein
MQLVIFTLAICKLANNTSKHLKYLCEDKKAFEHLHRSQASRMRRRKGNPEPRGITGPPCH